MEVPSRQDGFEQLLAEAFRGKAWRVKKQPGGADLVVAGKGKQYAVAMRTSSEGRSDRLIPLLSQSILEARSYAGKGAVPLAVVGARRIAATAVASAVAFAGRVAPDVAIGLMDQEGMRAFSGHGLESLNARPPVRERRAIRKMASRRMPNLFSDLNQWMLKLLLASRVPEDFLAGPRGPFRHATELARAAGVSIMSASRLVRQLRSGGFLDEDAEELRLVRVAELLGRWGSRRDPVEEFPVRWLIRRERGALAAMLQSHAAQGAMRKGQPRACLGLFAAADLLGHGFVHGVPPHLYLERFDAALLKRWGLTMEGAEQRPDAYIRIPADPESVFRAAVSRDGVPAADILQVWLDVQQHPSRGKAAAAEIVRRVLGPLLRKR
jgi:hypothetical protein